MRLVPLRNTFTRPPEGNLDSEFPDAFLVLIAPASTRYFGGPAFIDDNDCCAQLRLASADWFTESASDKEI